MLVGDFFMKYVFYPSACGRQNEIIFPMDYVSCTEICLPSPLRMKSAFKNLIPNPSPKEKGYDTD
jgi:hypothetical protein